MSEAEDYISASNDERAVAAVIAFPVRGLDRDSAAVHAFFREAQSRLMAGETVAMMGGPGPVPNGDRAALVTLMFRAQQIPLPMEEVIEWLREHPLVRVIEIDRFGANR
jgi:hypothetical protein